MCQELWRAASCPQQPFPTAANRKAAPATPAACGCVAAERHRAAATLKHTHVHARPRPPPLVHGAPPAGGAAAGCFPGRVCRGPDARWCAPPEGARARPRRGRRNVLRRQHGGNLARYVLRRRSGQRQGPQRHGDRSCRSGAGGNQPTPAAREHTRLVLQRVCRAAKQAAAAAREGKAETSSTHWRACVRALPTPCATRVGQAPAPAAGEKQQQRRLSRSSLDAVGRLRSLWRQGDTRLIRPVDRAVK